MKNVPKIVRITKEQSSVFGTFTTRYGTLNLLRAFKARNEGRDMNAKANKNLKSLICAGISILFITASAKATLVNSNSIVQEGIEYCIQTDKAVYDLGESVEMLYRVTNLLDEDVTLGWITADPFDYFDFWIMQDGIQIWEYPYLSVVLGFTIFHLDPYESNELQTVWNMMNDNGTSGLTDDDFQINPGIYDVIGELCLIEGERFPLSVSIQIIPEPSAFVLFGIGLMSLLSYRKRENF